MSKPKCQGQVICAINIYISDKNNYTPPNFKFHKGV